MIRTFKGGLGRKVILVTLSTTFVALLVTGVALTLYELRTYDTRRMDDLNTQAEIIGYASAPALLFNDIPTLQANLGLLGVRPGIFAAGIYDTSGNLIAQYKRPGADSIVLPPKVGPDGYVIVDDSVSLFRRVVEKGETVGTIYIAAQYGLSDRLENYLGIVLLAMGAGLIAAFLFAASLQRRIVRPVIALTEVARRVMIDRDFSRRVAKTSDDEIGYLVEAFNAMLTEVGRREQALKESNRTLQEETAVRREAEDALRQADRRKDEFLATLAHELRNPLAPLRTGLHLLRVEKQNSVAALDAREMMERQLKQLVRLVDDLLDVSRSTTGRLSLYKERMSLRTAVEDAIDTARPFIEQRGHELEVHLPDDPITMQGDGTRLAQVFSNLLNNAAKFTEPPGTITIRVERDGDTVTVRVTDTGIGIAPEDVSRIFEMFRQLDNSLERTRSGLGVGLTLSRRLVELHGGTLSVSSAGVGKGSEFVVTLPVQVPSDPISSSTEPSGKRAPTAAWRILLADDNVDFIESFALLLRMEGHDVEVAHDGEEALKVAERRPPDVAILDIGMPKINGYDVARRLRATEATSQCVLIAVTGWGQDSDRQRSKEAGFDHHLVKPIQLSQVETLLRQVETERSSEVKVKPA